VFQRYSVCACVFVCVYALEIERKVLLVELFFVLMFCVCLYFSQKDELDRKLQETVDHK